MTGGPGPRAAAGFGASPRLALLAALAVLASAQQAAAQSCVEATVGNERALSCINSALARMARQGPGPLETNTLGASSPAPAVGTFN